MNPEIREKWLAALESGEYKQCQGSLKTNDGFCCLGVLCDLHAKETGKEWKIGPFKKMEKMEYLNEANYLPIEVQNWADMDSYNHHLYNNGFLSHINDSGASFNQIADIIESEF